MRETVWALAEPLAAANDLVLVDVEWAGAPGRAMLRCILDKQGGLGLDDCAGFHQALTPLLDASDPIADSYVLEVSSPGLERPLRTERDFRLFAGRLVRAAAHTAIDGRREWEGRLLGVEDGRVLLAQGPEEGARIAVPLAEIAWARLAWPEQGGRRRLRRHPRGG